VRQIRIRRLAVAHLRLARMYEELAKLCTRCGDLKRAHMYTRRAELHLAEARDDQADVASAARGYRRE
jgi:hypothetical protein